MGNAFSQGNNVYVHLDKPVYYSGDTVNGLVCLNCVTPFQCNQVLLKVEGREKTWWQEEWDETYHENNESRSHRRSEIHSGLREFFKVQVQLYSVPQQCQPGQYQFPFTFALPMGLPGSFFVSGENGHSKTRPGAWVTNTRAKIKYNVKAECVVPGILKPNIRYKQEVMLVQRLEKQVCELKAEHCESVNVCCCFNKGNARVIANIQKDSYMPGESMIVILQVDNQSSIPFEHIMVYLKRRITLRSGGGWQEIDTKITSVTLPGIPELTSCMGDQARQLFVPLPMGLLASTQGSLISCQYTIAVKLKAARCMPDVNVGVPVTIYAAPPAYIAYNQLPPFWHPSVVAEPVMLSLPNAPPAAPYTQQMEQRGLPQYPQYPVAAGMPIGAPPGGYPLQQQQRQQQQQQQQQPYTPQQQTYPPQVYVQPGYTGQAVQYPQPGSTPQAYMQP